MASEVPTAVFIGIPESSTSAGTIKKPPPTPTRPVSAPTAMPSRAIWPMRGEKNSRRPPIAAAPPSSAYIRPPAAGAVTLTGFSMRQAAAYMTRANRVSWITTGVSNPTREPTDVPITPNKPNTSATRTSTRPRRQLSRAETVAVTASTPRLMAMADLGSMWSRYISAGRAMMDPPDPSNPSTSPVARPAISADKGMFISC